MAHLDFKLTVWAAVIQYTESCPKSQEFWAMNAKNYIYCPNGDDIEDFSLIISLRLGKNFLKKHVVAQSNNIARLNHNVELKTTFL